MLVFAQKPLERLVRFRVHGASAAAPAARLLAVTCGARREPSSHHINKSLEESSEHVRPEIERPLSENYVHRWLSWEVFRLRWPRAEATMLARIVETRMDGSIKFCPTSHLRRSNLNGLTHPAKRVNTGSL